MEFVTIIERTNEEMQYFFELTYKDYQRSLSITYDLDPISAKERVTQEIAQVNAAETAENQMYVFSVFDNNIKEEVGGIWFSLNTKQRKVFLYEILIYEKYRSNGYGKAAINQLYVFCRSKHIKKIGLSVFEWNKTALFLYEKLGFETIRRSMEKRV